MPKIRDKRNNNVKKSRQRLRTSGKKDERDWEEGPKGSAPEAKQCEERRGASER